MAADQEWCLECGAARTVIVRPPDWRVPVLVIGVIVLLIAGGFGFLITQLGDNAGKVTVDAQRSAGAGSPTAGQPRIGSWAAGLDGYTVVLATTGSRVAADRQATRFEAKLTDVGVLSTRQHPQMRDQGVWDVFAGHYPSYALAKAAAQADRHREAHAKPVLVQHPGGG